MNKKLIALSLVIGLSVSQVPMQAGWLDTWIAPERVEYFQKAAMDYVQEASKTVQKNPIAYAVAGGAAVALLYFGYNQYISPERTLDEVITEVLDYIKDNNKNINKSFSYKGKTINIEDNEDGNMFIVIIPHVKYPNQWCTYFDASCLYSKDNTNVKAELKKFISSYIF